MAYEYALSDVPTHHLQEAFRRAVTTKQRNHNDFVISGIDIGAEYLDMIPELNERARANAAMQTHLLMAGQGSLGQMTLREWKTRHNLPAEWESGEPYPPECDLYGKASPAPMQETYGPWDGAWPSNWYWGKWRDAKPVADEDEDFPF